MLIQRSVVALVRYPALWRTVVVALTGALVSNCGDPEGTPTVEGEPSVTVRSELSQTDSAVPGKAVTTAYLAHTTPYATCALHAGGDGNPKHHLKMFADAQGAIRFWGPLASVLSNSSLVVDCVDRDGVSLSSHPLEPQMAAQDALSADAVLFPSSAGDSVLPALSGEALLLPKNELMKRGYPPRPDPQMSPGEYSEWLAWVSQPIRLVRSDGVADSELPRHSNWQNNIWSGLGLKHSGHTYEGIYAHFVVPDVLAHGYLAVVGLSQFAFTWIGLDGMKHAEGLDGSQDALQGGVDATVQVFQDSNHHPFAVAFYSPWVEWFPDAAFATPNFQAGPGDTIAASIVIGNSEGDMTNTGQFGWFCYQNLTRHTSMCTCLGPTGYGCIGTVNSGQTYLTPDHTYGFRGDTAEWIVERNFANGTYPPLANYGTVEFSQAISWILEDYNNHTFLTDASDMAVLWNLQYTSILSNPTTYGAPNIGLTWYGYGNQ